MSIWDDAVVLVTGANGGLGTEFVTQAIARGARKVYASARSPKDWDDARIVPLPLDITDLTSIEAASTRATDVTILVNNAGISVQNTSLLRGTDEDLRRTLDTNLLGQIRMIRAFSDILAAAPGRAGIIDMHSALSWYAGAGSYSVSKAGFWAATNSVRLELTPRGVQVVGVHVGWVDTPMAASAEGPKAQPADVVTQAYDALTAGEDEVLADALSRRLKEGLAAPLSQFYPQLAAARGH
jgi:NAD(P)-dependent dehydrogenase (short-subunit alcohol dehydrogenase family)